MNPDNNLHAAERTRVDEWVQEALESYQHRQEWQEVLAFGERHAQAQQLTEADLHAALTAVRAELRDHTE